MSASDDESEDDAAPDSPEPGGAGRARVGDPVEFVRGVLEEDPYENQVEILEAVRDARRVSVVGCNGSGKDWAAARVVLWWLHSRYPAKAIVTGPTSRQVDDIVWNEMRSAFSRAGDALKGRMFRTSRYELDEQAFAIGFATNSAYNLQGFHSPNLLAVVTEAHAARQPDMEAIRRLHPAKLLMTGNPFVVAGVFFDSHHTKRRLYATVRISAFDTPNVKEGRVVVPGMVTKEDIEDRREEWGEDSTLYVGSVLGRFPDSVEGVLVPLSAATAAAKRRLEPEGPVVVGCDVARFGSDRTVAIRREGPVARIIWRAGRTSTMEVAGFLKHYCDDHGVDYLVVDDTGVGGGVVDRLREMGLGRTKLTAFVAAGRARKSDVFFNRVAEAWWEMAEAYKRGRLDTDDDYDLIAQVSSREYEEIGRRTKLKSKDGKYRSPDEADALAMTFAVERGAVRVWV